MVRQNSHTSNGLVIDFSIDEQRFDGYIKNVVRNFRVADLRQKSNGEVEVELPIVGSFFDLL